MHPIIETMIRRPDLTKITAQIEQLVRDSQQHLQTIWQTEHCSLSTALSALMQYQQDFTRISAPIRHWQAVAHQQQNRLGQQKIEEIALLWQQWLGQHPLLWQIVQNNQNSQLADEWRAMLQQQTLQMRLTGVGLDSEQKTKFQDRLLALQQLEQKFAEQLLDATQAFHWWIHDERTLAGLSDSCRQWLVHPSTAERLTPTWQLKLLEPVVHEILLHSQNPGLRQIVHHAYGTRASQASPSGAQFDNAKLCVQILHHRQAIAEMLDFSDYAEMMLVDRMADVAEVLPFLEQLLQRLKPAAQQEWLDICQQHQLDSHQVNPADIGYYIELSKQSRLGFNAEELRPYFAIENVIQGLLLMLDKLFAIKVKIDLLETAELPIQLWTVMADEQEIGTIIVDMYARRDKQGGAWLDDWLSHSFPQQDKHGPIALLNTNFNPNTPVFLSVDDVATLFHEMGHALHHVLTKISLPNIAGIAGVAWDVVEVPSQFLEAFAFDPLWLTTFAINAQHQIIPQAWMQKLQTKHQLFAGLKLLRQTMMSLFDWQLHRQPKKKWTAAKIQQLWLTIQAQWGVVPVAPYQHLAEQFSHIFDGGYACGYYSYLWAEVVAIDAYDYVLEDLQRGIALKDCVLSQGSICSFKKLYQNFRGTAATNQAWFNYYGINQT